VTDPTGRLLGSRPRCPAAPTTSPQPAPTASSFVPILADRAYIGAGPCVTTPVRRTPRREVAPTHSARRTEHCQQPERPGERGRKVVVLAYLRRVRCNPNRLPSINRGAPHPWSVSTGSAQCVRPHPHYGPVGDGSFSCWCPAPSGWRSRGFVGCRDSCTARLHTRHKRRFPARLWSSRLWRWTVGADVSS
jgi:hypothetical protein